MNFRIYLCLNTLLHLKVQNKNKNSVIFSGKIWNLSGLKRKPMIRPFSWFWDKWQDIWFLFEFDSQLWIVDNACSKLWFWESVKHSGENVILLIHGMHLGASKMTLPRPSKDGYVSNSKDSFLRALMESDSPEHLNGCTGFSIFWRVGYPFH